MKGIYILNPSSFEKIYGPAERRDIEQRVNLISEPMTADEARANPEVLAETELIFSGWGGCETAAVAPPFLGNADGSSATAKPQMPHATQASALAVFMLL